MSKIIEQLKRLLKNEYFLISIILIFAFLARLYKINNPIADWHSWRQADTASVTKIYVEEGINLLYPRYHDISSIQTGIFNPEGLRFVEFPVFNVIHASLYNTFATFSLEVWGRLLSIFSSLISTYILYLLGKRFIGKWGGILSAFFFAFLPFNIYFSRVILPEPLAVSFALFSMWLFVKFLDGEKSLPLYLSAISFAIAMLIKPFVFFYGLPLFYLAVKKYGLKGLFKDKRFLLAVDIALVPFFVWRIWINQFPAGIPFWKWAFNGDKIRFRPAFWRWIFVERLGRLILGTWGLIPFSFGLLKTKKENYFNLMFFFGVVLYAVVFATASVRHDYYQITMIPAISLLLAQGTINLWQTKNFENWLARPLLIFSIAMMLMAGAYQAKEYYKINRPEIIRAGAALDRIAPKDAIVIAPYNGDTAFLYQTGRRGWPAIDDSIDRIIEKGASFYVSVDLNHTDTQMVEERFRVVEKTSEYIIVDLRTQ